MSAKQRFPVLISFRRKALAAPLLALLLASAISLALPSRGAAIALTPTALDTCASAPLLMPGDSWHDLGNDRGKSCLRLYIPNESLLMVDLIQPATAARAHLGMLQPSDAEAMVGERSPRLLHRSVSTQLWRAPSGEYRIWISSDDPRKVLAPFQVQVGGAPPKTKDECDSELEIEPDPLVCPPVGALWGGEQEGFIPTKDENDSELEIEPDPLVGAPTGSVPSAAREGRVPTKDENDSELEIEPDPLVGAPTGGLPGAVLERWIPTKDENDSELEIEPDPLHAGPLSAPSDLTTLASSLSGAMAQLCAPSQAVGSVAEEATGSKRFACAQPLSLFGNQTSQINTLAITGASTYRFQIRDFRHLQLEIHREAGSSSPAIGAPLAVELFDRHGQRLAKAVEEQNHGAQLGKSLVPGEYFLRLHGSRRDVHSLSWVAKGH
ncbi:MAG: hypothetical protein AAGD01_19210 [Acidobacteriota bacterium]